MTFTWFNGYADERRIKVSDWTAAGVAGIGADTVWNAANAYAVDETTLTTAQKTLLAADPGFSTGNAANARPGAAVVSTPPALQHFPSNPVDGQVVAWSASQAKWVAVAH